MDASKKHISRLEGTIASLNEQLKAAQDESKTLKAGSTSAAALEGSVKREQTRAEVLCKAVAPKLCVLHLKRQASRSCGLLINTGIKQIALMLQRAGLCDRLAQDLQLHLPAFLSFVQAAEKKLQELQASVKQSEDAEAQVSGLKRELEQVQATLQASKDAAKAADTEKVEAEIHPWN